MNSKLPDSNLHNASPQDGSPPDSSLRGSSPQDHSPHGGESWQGSPDGGDPDSLEPGRPVQVDLPAQASGPEALIHAMPHLVGYDPGADPDRNTLVFLAVKDGLASGAVAAEYALPDILDAWQGLASSVVASTADALLIVAYGTTEQRPFLRDLTQQTAIPIATAVLVRADRWWDLLCTYRPRCGHAACTSKGARLTRPARDAVSEAFLRAGATTLHPGALLTGRLQPGPADLIRQVAALLPPHPPRHPTDDENRTFHHWSEQGTLDPVSTEMLAKLATARHERQPAVQLFTAQQAALLLIALSRPPVRLACSTWTDPGAVHLWADLLHLAPPAWRAVPAVQLALAACQAGDQILTGLALKEALDANPSDELAQLVAQLFLDNLPAQTVRRALLLAQNLRRPHNLFHHTNWHGNPRQGTGSHHSTDSGPDHNGPSSSPAAP